MTIHNRPFTAAVVTLAALASAAHAVERAPRQILPLPGTIRLVHQIGLAGKVALVAGSSTETAVVAIDPRTGQSVWERALHSFRALPVTMAIRGRRAHLAVRDPDRANTFTTVDTRTGDILWSARGASEQGPVGNVHVAASGRRVAFLEPIVLSDMRAVQVHCHDARTGTVSWARTLGGPLEGSDVWIGHAIMKGPYLWVTGFVGDVSTRRRDFMVRAYDVRNGELRWEDIFNESSLFDATGAYLAVRGSSLLAVGEIDFDLIGGVTPSTRPVVRAYGAFSGDLRWSHAPPAGVTLEAATGVVIGRRRAVVAAALLQIGMATPTASKLTTFDLRTGSVTDAYVVSGYIRDLTMRGSTLLVGGTDEPGGAGFVSAWKTGHGIVPAWSGRVGSYRGLVATRRRVLVAGIGTLFTFAR